MHTIKRQRELFEAALALEIPLRAAFVQAEAGSDELLCIKVLALLEQDQSESAVAPDSDRIRAPLQGLAKSLTYHSLPGPWLDQFIGPYRVKAEIGRGGMGVVLRAERMDGSFTQTVAIKVIQGIADDAARARFARERELLARLNHPNIAKLIDGGELTNATPYLVMEFVDGIALSQWVENRQPSLIVRLEMFRALCDAVHHAHQHLIVHRDLKPANVLIDADNRPKLLDFGIARLVDQSIGEHATTQRLMTLAYASPEQLRGGMATTASDVHGLGLLLYELLVGEPMRSQADAADAPRPETNSSLILNKKPSIQARFARNINVRVDAGRLKGDLDHIVWKCTRIDPSERYISAAAIAQDVSRYLAHRPLDSRRSEWRYATWKFIRRNPFAVGTLAISLAALIWFAAQLKVERDRAQVAAARATEQAALADQTTKYLVTLFKSADPANARGQELSARAVLDRGYAQLQKNTIDAATVRAKLFATFGEIYLEIGMPEPALAGLEQALGLLPDGDPYELERALILEHLSNAQISANQVPASMLSARRALLIYEAKRGPNSIEVARALIRIGICEQSSENFQAAHALFERARQIAQTLPGEKSILADALQYLGVWAVRTRQAKLAEDYLRQALTIKRALYGGKHPSTLDSLQALVFVLGEQGDMPAWEAASDALVAGRKSVHGADSSPYFQSLFARSNLQMLRLKLRDAEATSRAMVAGFAKLSAKPVFEDALAFASLATVLTERGDFVQAIQWQRRALDGIASAQALQSARGIKFRYQMARMLMLDSQTAAAQTNAQALLDALHAAGKDNAVEALETQLLLQCLAAVPNTDTDSGAALLEKIAALRGAQSPLLFQQALDLAAHDPDPLRALQILQRWQPRAKTIRLFEAKFALAIATRRLAVSGKSRTERTAVQQLLAPFITELRAEMILKNRLLQQLDALIAR